MAGTRYLIVMRHAHRQDEADEAWAEAEARRPGGRPFDPPLSSLGLSQAEAAAAKLVAWELRTGTRIVAVVASPFLRCLQTAAAACRRLGLPRLHVCWALSEALARLKDPPAGPLPSWMWPRPRDLVAAAPQPQPCMPATSAAQRQQPGRPGVREQASGEADVRREQAEAGAGRTEQGREGELQVGEERHMGNAAAAEAEARPELCGGAGSKGGSGGGSYLTSGEFLTRLGGVVEDGGAGGGSQGKAGQAAAGGASTSAGGAPDAAPRQQEPDAERPLAGLQVVLLPNLPDPRVTAATTSRAAAAGARLPRTDPSSEGGSAGPSPVHSRNASGGSGRRDAADEGALPGHTRSLSCEQPAPSGRHDPWVTTTTEDADATASPRPASKTSGEGPVSAALCSVRPSAPYGVPCTPETLEAAHERYRAVLRCLMEASAAAAAGRDAGRAALDAEAAAAGGGRDLATAASRAAGVADGGYQGAVAEAEAVWASLWSARDPSAGAGARTGPIRAGCGLGFDGGDGGARGNDNAGCRSAPADAPAAPDDVAEPARPGGRVNAAAAAVEGKGREGAEDGVGGDAGGYDGGSGEEPQQRRRRRQGDDACELPRGGAVLLVTHGEAVACAASYVAPGTLVYEVRHTGYVVLARSDAGSGGGASSGGGGEGGGGQDGGEGGELVPRAGGGGSGGRGAGAWELLQDPQGERGVLWMSTFDDE